MTPARTLLVMAAGTGGHIVPGLAIADELRARGWRVEWLGTRHGMENRMVPPHGVPLHRVDFSGLRGKGWRHTLAGCVKLPWALAKAWLLMARLKPAVVLGMGGYVTVPGGWAARLRGLPLVLVNADARLLLSNRTLAAAARRVLFGFDGNYGALAGKARCTGNPVRAEIAALAPPRERMAARSGPLSVLVVGGSLGARVLNETLPPALAQIPAGQRPRVVHQVGRGHAEAVRAAYEGAGLAVDGRGIEVVEFIDDMPGRYAQADLVVCRAGAITVSELAAAGVASILVPLMVSTTSHQRDNAEWMACHGAALHLPQSELKPQRLAELLQTLDRAQLLSMAEAAHTLGRRHATQDIADELERVAQT